MELIYRHDLYVSCWRFLVMLKLDDFVLIETWYSSCISLVWFLQCEFKISKVYFGWISSHLPFLDDYFWALNTTTVTVIFISYQIRRTFLNIQNFKHKWVRMWVYSMNTYYHKGLYLQQFSKLPFLYKLPRPNNKWHFI